MTTQPLRIHVPEPPQPVEASLRKLIHNYRANLHAAGLCQQAVDMMVAAATDFVGFVERHDDVHPPTSPA